MTNPLLEFRRTSIAGCFEISPWIHEDPRGRFVKIFNREWFAEMGLEMEPSEEFFSVSGRGVIRGLHFQVPPMDQVKLVFCISGLVQDAVVDLRRGSPTFGCHELFSLSSEKANIVYIPSGLAHGFCALSETATLIYHTSRAYSPQHDRGLLWCSAGIPWAISDPLLSDRDKAHPRLEDYRSPFDYARAQ